MCALAVAMERLSRILKDMTDSIDRLGMQWKEKSLAVVAGPYASYKAGDEIEITSSREMEVPRGGWHGGIGHLFGRTWLLRGWPLAQNRQGKFSVHCEKALAV